MFTWNTTERPIIALAPMAGVTDSAYRQLMKSLAPEIIVYTEFLSTDALHYGGKKTKAMMEFNPETEHPFIVQIFGKEPDHFVNACKVIEDAGAQGIDINMGCPAARVVSSCHGSALMRDPDLAARLVESATKEVHIPVSVKTRLGWDSSDNLIPFCKRLIDAGAQALAIHGRTYKQKYDGDAAWGPIYALKDAVDVPVIGNGDIRSGEDAKAKIGNLDGVMVGRATMGNPWILADIVSALRDNEIVHHQPESFQEKIPVMLAHARLAWDLKGRRGIFEMRKHFIKYIKGFDGAKDLRVKLMQIEDYDGIEKVITQAAS